MGREGIEEGRIDVFTPGEYRTEISEITSLCKVAIDSEGNVYTTSGLNLLLFKAKFSQVPDAPLSKVVVQMQGQKEGLIVNSTGICHGSHRADVRLGAQNGKRARLGPVARAACGKSGKGHGVGSSPHKG
jgi:hypothetical protein